MSYTADDTLSQNATFQGQVRMSMVHYANVVMNEARTIRNVVDLKRNSLANQVLRNPAAYVPAFVNSAIEAGALTGSSADIAIDGAVQSVWNFIAGVTTADLA